MSSYHTRPDGITMAQFSSPEKAMEFKRNNGGWLWVARQGRCVWFDAATFTVSAVLKHPAAQGDGMLCSTIAECDAAISYLIESRA